MARSKRATAPLPAVTQLAPELAQVFGTPRTQQRPLDEALDAKPAQFVAIFKEAALGKTRRQVDLGKSARRYDPRLNSVCATRVLAIGSRGYAVKPPLGAENDAEAQRIADFVSRHLYETRGFPTLKQHLAHGALEPHAVLEHVWSRNARGEVRTQPVWRHPNRFAWSDLGEISKLDPGVDTTPIPLSNWPNKFVVHSAVGGQSDYPWMRGALRPLLMLSLSGRFGLRWWLTALERFGQPQVYATAREGTKSADLIAALRALGSDWRAVVPEGVTFNELPVTIQDSLHQRFLDYVNVEKAVGILGQNLSTEVKAGSYAAAKSQERVRADILAADLAELDETITDQWIRPLVLFNFGPGAPVPYIEHTLDQRVPFTLADYQAGVCTADEYRADNGHDPEADGRGDKYSNAASVPVGSPVFNTPASTDPNAVASVADTAFNGAQLTAITALVPQVQQGLMPKESAIALVLLGFPDADVAKVRAVFDPIIAAPAAPPPGAAPAAPRADESKVKVGEVWTDTEDNHRIKVTAVDATTVWFVDLDDANPNRQWSWTLAHFLERAQPPAPATSGGDAAAPPLPQAPPKPSASPTSSTSPSMTHPLRSALSRR